MSRQTNILLVAVMLFVVGRAEAQKTRRLSLDESIILAQSGSPLLQGAKARLEGTVARVGGTRVLANPTLQLAAHAGQNTGSLDEDIIVARTFELGDKLRQRLYAAKAERDSAHFVFTQTRQDVAYKVRSAYFDALLSDAEFNESEESLKTAKALATAADTQLKDGDAPRSNVVRARIEISRFEQDERGVSASVVLLEAPRTMA